MKKRLISLLLAAVMLASLLSVSSLAAEKGSLSNFKKLQTYKDGTFTDVNSADWFYSYVVAVFEYELMVGRSDKLFATDAFVTVAEAMTIAARLHSIYYTGKTDLTQSTPWYQVYADYCKANGIADPANYELGKPITRGQFAEIFAKAFPADALKKINTVQDDMIPDVKTADSYGPAVYLLYRAGVLNGNDSKGTFAADSNIKRVEAAAITGRMADPALRQSITLGKEEPASNIPTVVTLRSVTVPTAVQGLTYNAQEQTGVEAARGYTLTGNTATDAGTYTATATLESGYMWSDHTIAPKSIEWTIAKKAATVTAAAAQKTWNESDPQLTAQVNGTIGQETLNYTLARAQGEDIGKYDITVTPGSNPNYDVTPTGAKFTINPVGEVTVPEAVDGLVYDGKEHTGVAGGLHYSLSGEYAKTDAGEYTATATLDNGYVWASDKTTAAKDIAWSIARANVTVTAKDKSRDLDAADPVFDATVTGLIGQDTVSYNVGCGNHLELPGEYFITPYGSKEQGNYKVTFVDGTLTITEVGKVTVPSANGPLTYNGTEQTGVTQVTGVSLTGNKATAAGEYTATATPAAGYIWEDGTKDPVEIDWEIAPKTVTVKPKKVEKTIGAADPLLDIDSCVGIIDADKVNVSYTGALSREPGENYGLYDITQGTLAFTGSAADNYELSFEGGTDAFSITATAKLTVPTGYNGTYDGKQHYFTASSLTNINVVSGKGTTTATDAGTYTAYVKPVATYCWADGTNEEKTITWTIAKATLKFTVTGGEKTYGGSDPQFTVTPGTPVQGETLNGLGVEYRAERETGEDVGSYDVDVVITAGNTQTNYKFDLGSATFTIKVKEITPTIILSSTSATWSKDLQFPTVTVKDGTKVISSDYYTVEWYSDATPAPNPAEALTYTAKVTLKDNYAGKGEATFTVNPVAPN